MKPFQNISVFTAIAFSYLSNFQKLKNNKKVINKKVAGYFYNNTILNKQIQRYIQP